MVDATNSVDIDKTSDGNTNKSIDTTIDMKINEKSNIRLHKELEKGNKNGDRKEDSAKISDGKLHPRDVEVRFNEGTNFIKKVIKKSKVLEKR